MSDTEQPAFPIIVPIGGPSAKHIPGMTLLDYFAGQALIGIIASGKQYAPNIAKDAYEIAAEMMEARPR